MPPSQNNNYIYELYKSANLKSNATVYSKEFTFGEAEQEVMLYFLRWNSTDTSLNASIAYDGGSFSGLTEAADVAGQVYNAPLDKDWHYKVQAKFVLTNTAGDELSAYSIIFRPRPVQ